MIRLGQRASITAIELQTKPNRFSAKATIYIGSLDSTAVEYQQAGSTDRITHTSTIQVSLVGIGSHIKIKFEVPPKTASNPYGQIGLQILKVYGQPDGYH